MKIKHDILIDLWVLWQAELYAGLDYEYMIRIFRAHLEAMNIRTFELIDFELFLDHMNNGMSYQQWVKEWEIYFHDNGYKIERNESSLSRHQRYKTDLKSSINEMMQKEIK